jgi:hypothetical protein
MSTPPNSLSPQHHDPDMTETLPVNGQTLMALSLSDQDAHRIAELLGVRERIPTYWRRLIEAGIPLDEARSIAKAIAHYDAGYKPLSLHQKELIMRYCAMIGRAELWRPQLLL